MKTGQGDRQPIADIQASESEVASIADEIWAWRLDTNIDARLSQGLPIEQLPTLSDAQAIEDMTSAEAFLQRMDSIDQKTLDVDSALTKAFLEYVLANIAVEQELYPFEFIVTPYQAGFKLNPLLRYAAAAPLKTQEERVAFLSFLEDYGAYVRRFSAKLDYQASKGIYLPEPAIPGVRKYWSRLIESRETLRPSVKRLTILSGEARDEYLNAVGAVIDSDIRPAYERVVSSFDEAYVAKAPNEVGLRQYDGGARAYALLIERFTSSQQSAEELHGIGLARMSIIQTQMKELREELGFKGTAKAFHEMLNSQERFRAKSPQEVEQKYLSAMERIEPLIENYFSLTPAAPYGVLRAAPATEAGLTYGYYQAPSTNDPRGYYRYNGAGLEGRSQVSATALIYHELIPGHHFQIALQQELEGLHPMRRFASGFEFSAYIEGWAEYASRLGSEMGLYEDPYDRYGRLLMDAFATARLIVDTGVNGLGWSLEDARDYMLENTIASEAEIASETLRYSTDIPGQALSYAIGPMRIEQLRAALESKLGDDFDIKEFHALVLNAGPVPLNVLDEYVHGALAAGDLSRGK